MSLINETLNYAFEEKKQSDNNIGVIHIYRKNNNAWVGFIRYIKSDENGKPFVKFYASDLGYSLDQQFQYELAFFSKELAKVWQEEDGIIMQVKSNMEVKFEMEIDKGDGSPIKKVIV